MVRNILLAGVLAAAFVAPAFAATTAPAPVKKFYVEMVGGVCKVSDGMTAAPTLTAPDKLEPSTAGYKSAASANSDLAKLVKAKTCKTA